MKTLEELDKAIQQANIQPTIQDAILDSRVDIDANTMSHVCYRAGSSIGALASVVIKLSVGDMVRMGRFVNRYGEPIKIDYLRTMLDNIWHTLGVKIKVQFDQSDVILFRSK